MKPLKEFIRMQRELYTRELLSRHSAVSTAARTAGVSRTHLHKLMKQYGIKPPNPAHLGSWGV